MPLQCSYCSRSYQTMGHLTSHIFRIHQISMLPDGIIPIPSAHPDPDESTHEGISIQHTIKQLILPPHIV
jgi:hypothetical protein